MIVNVFFHKRINQIFTNDWFSECELVSEYERYVRFNIVLLLRAYILESCLLQIEYVLAVTEIVKQCCQLYLGYELWRIYYWVTYLNFFQPCLILNRALSMLVRIQFTTEHVQSSIHWAENTTGTRANKSVR